MYETIQEILIANDSGISIFGTDEPLDFWQLPHPVGHLRASVSLGNRVVLGAFPVHWMVDAIERWADTLKSSGITQQADVWTRTFLVQYLEGNEDRGEATAEDVLGAALWLEVNDPDDGSSLLNFMRRGNVFFELDLSVEGGNVRSKRNARDMEPQR